MTRLFIALTLCLLIGLVFSRVIVQSKIYDGFCEPHRDREVCRARQIKFSGNSTEHAVYLTNTKTYLANMDNLPASPLGTISGGGVLYTSPGAVTIPALIADFELSNNVIFTVANPAAAPKPLVVDVMLSHVSSSSAPGFPITSQSVDLLNSAAVSMTSFDLSTSPSSVIYAKRFQMDIFGIQKGTGATNPLSLSEHSKVRFYYNLLEDSRISQLQLQPGDRLVLSVRVTNIDGTLYSSSTNGDPIEISGTLGYQYSFP